MSNRKMDRAAALIETGMRRLQEGQFVQARLVGEQALQLAPKNPDALHLLGVIALHDGEHATAVEKLRKAVSARPDDATFLANLAYAHIGLNQISEALHAFERASRLEPGDPDLQLGVGNCLAMLGRPKDAEGALRRLVDRHPSFALGWFNLANALKDQERYSEAHDCYVRTTQLAPRLAEAHCNLAIALHKLGKYEDAEQSFLACLRIDPGFTPAYVSLGITLNSLRRHAEAEARAREALSRDPNEKRALPVLGKALVGLNRWHDAAHCYQQAVQTFPDSGDAWGDYGHALANVGRIRDALEAFARAHALGVSSTFVHFYHATALFAAGRMADGAAQYLGRHERSIFVEQHPECPLAWELPRDVSGRAIELIGEQGIGDELFFLRHAPRLARRGARLGYCGHRKLGPLLERSGLFDHVTSSFEFAGSADDRILVGDLPHLLHDSEFSPLDSGDSPTSTATDAQSRVTKFPWHCRVYWPELPPPLRLSASPERLAAVEARLRTLGPPPYVGVTWRAGTGAQEQRGFVWLLFKEAPLDGLASALRSTPGTLLSLQRGPAEGETEKFAALLGRPLHDLSAANDDLEEMLAILELIDDYVGVSNTNMHLRASAGRTAKVLVPWPAEWRWLTYGDASPWFPGFRIYRQRPDGNWNTALRLLAGDLGQS